MTDDSGRETEQTTSEDDDGGSPAETGKPSVDGDGVPDDESGEGPSNPERATEDIPEMDAGGPGSETGDVPDDEASGPGSDVGGPEGEAIPEDVREYTRFSKIDGSTYDRANEFLRERTYITAREWAIARLCADFRTETGVEMTKIGENLPELIPFMTDTYSPQAVNQARASFEEKVRLAGATFLYGALSDFFTAEELDDVMYEATEVAKFLLEVEGVDLAVEEELEAEERVSDVMREVREHSVALRHDEVTCPECGTQFEADGT